MYKKILLCMMMAMVGVSLAIPVPAAAYNFGDYRSVTLITNAWQALGENDLEAVLAYTNKCVELYAEQ
ncbi:MAG TPA: hypothetical protein PKU74_10190, partial [Candidatus Omnitrophota bacterium]|nr:hypothetical protein [Candidatus Omnitrophota bacterium]